MIVQDRSYIALLVQMICFSGCLELVPSGNRKDFVEPSNVLSWIEFESVRFDAFLGCVFLCGEGEDERRLVPYLHKQLAKGEAVELTSGKQIRDFLDVSEAGRIIEEVALSEQRGPINVCSGKPITVRQLAEQIADTHGRRDLLKFGARPDNLVDPSCVLGIPNHSVAEKTA